MNRPMALIALMGLGLAAGAMLGCEEKTNDSGAKSGVGGLVDSAKGAADKAGSAVKDAGKTVTDTAKAAADKAGTVAADAAKTATDKGKELAASASDALKKEVGSMVENAKGQLQKLTDGGKALPADKKPDFDKAVGDLNGQFKSLSDTVSSGFKDMTGDGLTKKLGELKDQGSKLLSGIKSTAEKFGIKL